MATWRTFTRGVGAAVGALVLAGCAGSAPPAPVDRATREAYSALTIDVAECGAASTPTVTPEDMERDWAVLETVLRRGYAGYELAGDEARWRRAFAEGREATDDGPMTVSAFRDAIVEHLRFADDNHLAFTILGPRGRDWRSTSRHRQAWVADAALDEAGRGRDGSRLVACEGHVTSELLRPVLDGSGEVRRAPVVLSDTPPEPLTCRFEGADGTVDERVLVLSRLDIRDGGGPRFEQRDVDGVTWIRLRTLAASRRDVLERFVSSAADARAARATVLDLRRIGGGADRYLNAWFASYTDRDLAYWDTRRIVSEVALQGALSFWGCIEAASSGDAGGRAWVRERVQRARRDLESAMERRGVFRDLIDGEYVVEGEAPGPPAGPLILLVDRGCASACETSVVLARQIPGAIVVGENTEGTMKVGEIRSYRLPASGIVVTAGTRIHRDPVRGTFPEGTGWLPDVWVPGDVEASVGALARCLGDPSCAARARAAIGPRGEPTSAQGVTRR